MKKYLLIIFLLCGCSKDVVTFIENNNNTYIAINYPVTNIKKLDKQIKKHIENIHESFNLEYEIDVSYQELNISYDYFETEEYINVVIYTFITSSRLAHPINEIKTFVYDKNKNKIITLSDLISLDVLSDNIYYIKEQLINKYKDCLLMELLMSKIIPSFDSYENFTISDNLTLYFNPYEITSGYCNIINIEIPSSKLGLNIKTNNDKTMVKVPNKIIDPNQKMIAITFDDGPSRYTNEILDILNNYEVTATFFILGNKVSIYKDVIGKALYLGNEIGNHSYSHKWLTKLNEEEFKMEISKTQNIIKENFNYTPILLRPTYGSINKKIKGYTDLKIVLWTVDSLDWKIKNPKQIAERVLKDVKENDIILFHDTHKQTLEAIKIIIPKLIDSGYQLVTVSELEEFKKLKNLDNILN